MRPPPTAKQAASPRSPRSIPSFRKRRGGRGLWLVYGMVFLYGGFLCRQLYLSTQLPIPTTTSSLPKHHDFRQQQEQRDRNSNRAASIQRTANADAPEDKDPTNKDENEEDRNRAKAVIERTTANNRNKTTNTTIAAVGSAAAPETNEEDFFYSATWPPMQKVLCGDGAPNLHLSALLFRLARFEVFPTEDSTSNSSSNTTRYAPTRPLSSLNTTAIPHRTRKGTPKPSPLVQKFFRGHWGTSVMIGNHTNTNAQRTTHFQTQFVRIFKCGNNQVRELEQDLANHLGTADYHNNTWTLAPIEAIYPELQHQRHPAAAEIETCLYTVVRDPVAHFLSGYNEVEHRQYHKLEWGESPPYHTDVPYSADDPSLRRKRFRAFVEDLLVETEIYHKNWQFSHVYAMSRVLPVLASNKRTLTGYIPDVANLTDTWVDFVSSKCPGIPPREAFPVPERKGQHESAADAQGFYRAAREVWEEGGPVARALCLLSAPDYACYRDLPGGVPALCREVFADYSRTLTDYGSRHYLVYATAPTKATMARDDPVRKPPKGKVSWGG